MRNPDDKGKLDRPRRIDWAIEGAFWGALWGSLIGFVLLSVIIEALVEGETLRAGFAGAILGAELNEKG